VGLIYEVRAQAGDWVHSFGARTERADAERLLAESQRGVAEAGGKNDRYWIEEIDTTGLFEIPSRPTPRERYSVRVTPRPERKGMVTTVDVHILDGQRVVASYHRNYDMLRTFEPFRQGDRDYALISPNYTATSVIDLQTGEIVASEEPDALGFCPVGFYVPDWWDVHPSRSPHVVPGHPEDEPFMRPGTLGWEDEHEWPSRGDFGFVWGCIWGDDSSWKVQYLDLSEIRNGVIRREERFGYLKLAAFPQLDAPEFIQVWERCHVRFVVEKDFDLRTGREITDDWDPWDEVDAVADSDGSHRKARAVKRTPRVEQAIHRAELLAESLGDNFVGTEHLLLALAQDRDGVASRVLAGLGVRGDVEKQLRAFLESDSYNPDGRPGRTPPSDR
jgi:hypothetical protein